MSENNNNINGSNIANNSMSEETRSRLYTEDGKRKLDRRQSRLVYEIFESRIKRKKQELLESSGENYIVGLSESTLYFFFNRYEVGEATKQNMVENLRLKIPQGNGVKFFGIDYSMEEIREIIAPLFRRR